MNDPYQILNIPPTATDEEVKRAYRDLARNDDIARLADRIVRIEDGKIVE